MEVNLEQLIDAMKATRYNNTFAVNMDTGEVVNKDSIHSTNGHTFKDIPYLNQKELMEDFVAGLSEEEQNLLNKVLLGRDNFKRFFDQLKEMKLDDYWQRYRDFAYEDEAKAWCEKNDITVVDEGVRPYIICHMLTSIDGKVTGPFLEDKACVSSTAQYFEIHRNTRAEGFACGRVTMEGSFTKGNTIDLSKYEGKGVPLGDYIADEFAPYYAVAFDRKGRLGWTSAYIEDEDSGYDGAHIVEVLTQQASNAYKLYLREQGISYVIAGKEDLDLDVALAKLYRLCGIRRLLLEGGSVINGAFFEKGYVDELSLVIAPLIAADTGADLFPKGTIARYELVNHRRADDQTVYARYIKEEK